MTDIEKAKSVAANLRAMAEARAEALKVTLSYEGMRDIQADAMADLAELVLGLVIAQTPSGDQ